MKHIRTILALLLCLCMLPLNALAYTVEPGGTHQRFEYTPETSWLYAVKVQKDGETLSHLPAGIGPDAFNPAMVVSVTAGGKTAQEVDYNVFGLAAAVPYAVQLQNKLAGTLDDSGEWEVYVEKIAVERLALNADAFTEGEWFTFTPSKDGEYTIAVSARPAFVEVFARGRQSGDWEGYANDKEAYRIGAEDLANGTEQLDAFKAEHLKAQADLEKTKGEIAGLEAALAQEKSTYDKALRKLDNYQTLIDRANENGLLDGSAYDSKKQTVYLGLKVLFGALGYTDLPAKYTDLPAYLTEQLETNEAIRDRYQQQQAELEQKQTDLEQAQKEYDAQTKAIAEAEEVLAEGHSRLDELRNQIQSDANDLMSAPATDDGLALQSAVWLREAGDVLTATMKAGEVYTIHVLSDSPAALAVSDKGEEPPVVVIDKSALEQAIANAEAVVRDNYTPESLALMDSALEAAKGVLANASNQAAVDAAAKALNDAVAALREKEPVTNVDKSALEAAIAAAEKINTEEYTADSVAKLTEALTAAKAVLNNEDADQTAVNDAAKALEDAVKGLKKESDTVDKTELNDAIARAEAIDRDKYTEDSLKALDAALNAAKLLVPDSFLSTQRAVDFATATLNKAIDGLVEESDEPDTVDKTGLINAITAAEAVDTTKYTDDSVAAMQKALTDAKAVRGNDAAKQDEVNAAAAALNKAVNELVKKDAAPTVDKEDLKQLVKAADELDRSRFTDASLVAFDAANQAAKAVLADENANQDTVNNAFNALVKAFNELKMKDTTPDPDPDPTPDPAKCDGGANCPSKKFTDVNQKAWYHEAVDYAIVNKLFNGTSPTTFAPDTSMTRGMLVTVLYRMEGEPPVTGTTTFTDLRQGWYKPAVAWAAENEIVKGLSDTRFAPEANVTREQAMTMLMRYAQYKGYDVSARANLSAFTDASSVHIWALDAMQWAVKEGLINGMTPTTLNPRDNSNRAQIAAILMRFQENIAK